MGKLRSCAVPGCIYTARCWICGRCRDHCERLKVADPTKPSAEMLTVSQEVLTPYFGFDCVRPSEPPSIVTAVAVALDAIAAERDAAREAVCANWAGKASCVSDSWNAGFAEAEARYKGQLTTERAALADSRAMCERLRENAVAQARDIACDTAWRGAEAGWLAMIAAKDAELVRQAIKRHVEEHHSGELSTCFDSDCKRSLTALALTPADVLDERDSVEAMKANHAVLAELNARKDEALAEIEGLPGAGECGAQLIANRARHFTPDSVRAQWEAERKVIEDVLGVAMTLAGHYYNCLNGQRGASPGDRCSDLCRRLRALAALRVEPA